MTEATPEMTRILAAFIVSMEPTAIPSTAYDHAKVAFMDWLAVTYGGASDPLVAKLTAYAKTMGGHPQATLIGQNTKMNVAQAALINGACSHALDYDDTLVTFFGHPSVTLFPSLLALAEWKEISGFEFLTAYLIGLQAGGTIGRCAGLEHYMAGWHATSTLGHFASAAACSRLLKLDKTQTAYALGIAGTQSSGIKRVFGTMCKPFHAGNASQTGLMAALLARDNFSSAEDILEGRHGFFEIMKGKVDPEVLANLGLGWDVEDISQKYHASCHATHSPLEAALAIIKEHQVSIDDIKIIRVFSSKLALDAAGKLAPTTGLEGKFSIPYCLANAVIRGETGTSAFTDDNVNDPKIRDLITRIEVVLDETKTGLEATVKLETINGKQYESFSDILQKIPPLEVKQDRIEKKFIDLCSAVLETKRVENLIASINTIDKIDSMKSFAETL
ncbi:MmgE/PrpD family protein [bacterium]|nr:MmgE/PrpD family protein [bacterium]